ncbi:nucleotide exchange factor GrpE [Endomicrobium proavitum]|uniref:Protein GrpE n=1 Tax=Endomicrobium proavitum TaxID=1408281 RepID=A0A0G3WJW1_9BACT|nr:nucleotide exchange factor GrpE [Endomicrobium proavitum]AKL98162.1 nucleotide exchange factor for DnaK activity [Endomicrobium proavitum]
MEQKKKQEETKAEEQSCEEIARDEKLSELEILKQSFDEKKKEAENLYDQLVRLQADFSNFRRRTEDEKKKYLEWGKEKILQKQIFLDDILEQALKSAQKGNNIESIVTGLEMITKEFSKMLKEEGVEEIKCDKFDPHLCEALDSVETEDEEDGKVLEVYQKGYTINGNLMRPAKVKVSKSKVKSGMSNELL